jgi:serine/threonine protein kinase
MLYPDMAQRSDLVEVSRLTVSIQEDYVIQGKPFATAELWHRERQIGTGSFGVVWLEKCVGGPEPGALRAVKEVKLANPSTESIDFARELEATAKFSQKQVRFYLPMEEGVIADYTSMNGILLNHLAGINVMTVFLLP